GKVGNNARAIGPNAWLLLALNYYTLTTKDSSYVALSKAVADWIISFQNQYRGGVWGGVDEHGGKFLWMSTEHNLDCYAGLSVLYQITGKKRYKTVAFEIKRWLDDYVWNPWTRRFYNGGDDPNFATDVSSWAVLSLLEEPYFVCLDFAVDYSENRQFYNPNKIEIAGFDFGSSYARSPYPDKDAVWFEGTGQMILAFYLAGRIEESDYFLEEMKKALIKSDAHNDSTGLPYASNPGSPPYGGWVMPDKPICISSTAWFLFSLKKFNPFWGNIIKPGEKKKIVPVKEIEEKVEEKEEKEEKPLIDEKIEEELFGD
ncbi:MAG: hypothetical protein JW827_01245, partial [Spirochaetes bacterium]|nr:hypothetical protein [Spirochaetota bacterium]